MPTQRQFTPANINNVTITDSFWSEIMETVRTKVIPYQWEALNDRIEDAEPSYCMKNFAIAGRITMKAAEGIMERGEEDKFQGYVFQDSDFAKWIEAVGYTLMNYKDEELERIADGAISIVCSAQQPDGYLDTYYIINGLEGRFTNLRDNHELYCLGHLMEGAIAYYKATGKDKLLKAVMKYADLVDKTFGPEPEKLKGYPGHEILEMALVRLYEVTKEDRYLKLAKYFVDERGKQPLYFVEEEMKNNLPPYYWRDSIFKYQYQQAGKPIRDQEVAEGHAVRAVYLYAGMADVARFTGDEELMATCERLWNNITTKQMYITGGIGASSYGEAFTYDYDLPNDTVYAETCASIGLAFFANRMLRNNPNAKYADVCEKALYNGIISGMSLDGTKFFYVNPLEVIPEASEKDQLHRHVRVERQKWFGCACCPPNLARILSSLGQYAYGESENEVFLHLFMSGSYKTIINGQKLSLNVQTEYPWKNKVSVVVLFDPEITSDSTDTAVLKASTNSVDKTESINSVTSTASTNANPQFTLAIRIPGWCKESTFSISGESITPDIKDGYAYFNRAWANGDQIVFEMAMPVELISANPRVRENIGKVAVMRGPIVYCLEEADNGNELHKIYLDSDSEFETEYNENLLGGVVTLRCNGYLLDDSAWAENSLYQSNPVLLYQAKPLTWIPYYTWANRTPGEMIVWVNHETKILVNVGG